MNVKMIVESDISRPTPDPLGSSVLDHATVATTERFGLRNNNGLWPSYNCLDTWVPTAMCPDPPSTKSFQFPEWITAFDFAVHAGVQCKIIGLDRNDMEAEIARVFARNEGKGVESSILENRFVARINSSDETGPEWGAPSDLTPSTPVPLSVALALLEGHAANVYAGLPTIHMPRAAASVLGDRIVWSDGKAYTRNGSKVAIGGGYDEPGMLNSGKWDMYATGEVYVERSETLAINSFVLPGDGSGTGSDENGLSDNTAVALVERMYRVGVDCFVAKATGTVWS